MGATVYTTAGGRRFHTESWCPALTTGRDLFGWLCSGYGPVYPLREIIAGDAALAGYTACRVCVLTADALPATGETYGHEPVEIWGDQFCPICREHGVDEDGEPWWYPVLWPCTSAIVLGIVLRPEKDWGLTA